MSQNIIIAYFDHRSDASQALEALVADSVARSSIRLMPETETTYTRTERSSYDRTRDDGGFWASLGDLSLPDEDRYAYSEGMSRGGVTLSIMTDEAQVGRIADILERYNAVDIDERQSTWRNEGWSGYTAAGTSNVRTSGSSTTSAERLGAAGRSEETIPLVEEQLRIGKRSVEHGRVRIRSYVVETPVEEQVSLRQEHVHVERRPVDRPVSAADESLFQERTIDAEEVSEEAVVSKEARVREELVIGKDVEERTQTVRDTVRRTEVEVEDERSGGTRGAASDRTTNKRRI